MRDGFRLVKRAHHEPVVLGDFVHLNSGSPLGLVINASNGMGEVAWIGTGQRCTLPLVCLTHHVGISTW